MVIITNDDVTDADVDFLQSLCCLKFNFCSLHTNEPKVLVESKIVSERECRNGGDGVYVSMLRLRYKKAT